MKGFITDAWWKMTVGVLIGANSVLFLLMMFWIMPVSYFSLSYLFDLLWTCLAYTWYLGLPLTAFGFLSALGWSAAKRPDRAATLAWLSGGALVSTILVWSLLSGWY